MSNEQWRNNWEEIEGLPDGGQGFCKLVKKKNNDTCYFLKELKRQKNVQSRKQMHREVACYETLEFHGIPRLIESNAREFKNFTYKLYLITEYIHGHNLQDQKASDTKSIIQCILRLCEIISYCHKEKVVHRDIKPKNIILHNNNWNDPFLVDFGISHYNNEGVLNEKSDIQEIGPRFLRLPEFSISSNLQIDPRSDVTLCAGILFFLLTGIQPGTLLDEKGCAPHRRKLAKAKLKQYIDDLDINKLCILFDQAFDNNIDKRLQSIEEFSQKINELPYINRKEILMNIQDKKERIQSLISSHSQKNIRQVMHPLETLIKQVQLALENVRSEFNGAFGIAHADIHYDTKMLEISGNLGVIYTTNADIKCVAHYRSYATGNEIILSANNNILYRHPMNMELDAMKVREIVREYVILEIFTVLQEKEEIY